MAEPHSFRPDRPLARLHRLEWRYDGPFPGEALPPSGAPRGVADAALLDRLAGDVVRGVAMARRRTAAAELHRLPWPEAASTLARYRRTGLAQRAAGWPPS